MELRKRVLSFIRERDLLRPGMTVILGVSGGPDSLCLLDLIHALPGELPLDIQVAHLNHGLRHEAVVEAVFVRGQAEKRGLPFHTETVDTRSYAARHKQSLEEAARELRYDFLARTARAAGAAAIAVAHTADDQAETVLMHFLRGSGLGGLRGMLPRTEVGGGRSEVGKSSSRPVTSDIQPLALVRPLLFTTRAEVEAYCAERGLQPVHDATNLDPAFFRNRLRHELLPELEKYNPNIREVLRRTAEVTAGEHELLVALTEALWHQTARFESGQVRLDRVRWLTLSLPERRVLLREAVHRLLPNRRDIDFVPLEHAIQFSHTAAPGRSCDVLGGLRLRIETQSLVLENWATGPELPGDIPLLNERGELAESWRFAAEMLGPGQWNLAEVESLSSGRMVFVDAARAPAPLALRSRRPGDRFQPLGLEGHSVKVSDFMVNAKIDEHLRERWPLVVCGDEIVWVAGLRLDERFRVTAQTRSVLRLSLTQTGP